MLKGGVPVKISVSNGWRPGPDMNPKLRQIDNQFKQLNFKEMKKKISVGLGIFALIAVLFLNIIQANASYPKPDCNVWCLHWDYHQCVLHTPDYNLICWHQYWP